MNTLRFFVLMAAMTGLFLVLGQLLGGHNGMLIALAIAGAMNFWAWWNSDQAVLAMYNAIEVGPDQAPELYGIVRELARRGNLPMPRVYVIDDPSPNAFATGRDPEHAAVAATSGILRILTREELAGVMAHELAHVQHRDILIGTMTATLAGAITTLANFAGLFSSGRSDDEEEERGMGWPGQIVMLFLAPLAATLIQMAVSRSREYDADQGGARLCGNPLWLASALHKLERGSQNIPLTGAAEHPATAHLFIVSPLSAGLVAGLFSTHPPMEERIARLQGMVHSR
ncbi:MAG: zinc metalloprotease HtpX [Magnetococcales bacterium]|nr:zinc metalloprotease HtpX [Magnetococcales bacterium]